MHVQCVVGLDELLIGYEETRKATFLALIHAVKAILREIG